MNTYLKQIKTAKHCGAQLHAVFAAEIEFENNKMTLSQAIEKMEPAKIDQIHMGGRPFGKTAIDHKKFANALLAKYAEINA